MTSSPDRADIDAENEVRLTKIPSLLRRMNLPAVVHLNQQIPSVVEGAIILVRVLSTVGKRTFIECIAGQGDLAEGDVIPAVLGKRRMFKGVSCDIPDTLVAGDILHWSSWSGMVGKFRCSDNSWGQPLPVRVLGSAQVSGQFLNIKQADIIGRLQHLDAIAPVVCVAGTATNTGKTRTAAEIVRHFKSKGHKVACAKLTGNALLEELRKLSSTGADLVLGFMDAGLPSTCGPATPVAEVALGILHRLNQIQPDVIVVEFGASFLGLYNAETILRSPEFQKHVASVIVTASDPVAAWGAKQIMDRWGIAITAFTGPVVNSKVFEAYVEETLQVPAEDNREAMPKITRLVELELQEFKRRLANMSV
ncbi:hypothetical protein HIM_05653 [Hirsutella minnesotensis 3608]|uniref:DUF1611 domain-containing protein n=1 Tax=Hirsutella minnesotensis 3608 TaxID=1043627 RepID=A0A0F7ZZZ7_9HYPO|nr:hypothetical protein HIM_05653 [Hirsutella minnesotensis 3608]